MVTDDENCRQPVDLGRININERRSFSIGASTSNAPKQTFARRSWQLALMTWDVNACLLARKEQVRDDS